NAFAPPPAPRELQSPSALPPTAPATNSTNSRTQSASPHPPRRPVPIALAAACRSHGQAASRVSDQIHSSSDSRAEVAAPESPPPLAPAPCLRPASASRQSQAYCPSDSSPSSAETARTCPLSSPAQKSSRNQTTPAARRRWSPARHQTSAPCPQCSGLLQIFASKGHRSASPRAARSRRKIGRASCRERV